MSPRELIILLLGLAIVAVVLRGLYVAIRARRGQIRLAIDKNIPKDIDIEALEMAELPAGGARVVSRDGDRVDPQLTAARSRADDLDLGPEQDEAIPVLMDAVQINQPPATGNASSDPDEILLDYGEGVRQSESDGMAAVAPDYGEEEEGCIPGEDRVAAPRYGDEGDGELIHDLAGAPPGDEAIDGAGNENSRDESFDDRAGDESVASEAIDVEDFDGFEDFEHFEDSQDGGEDDESELDAPALSSSASFEDSLEAFSLTAGERIGFNPRSRQTKQTHLFDELEEHGEPEAAAPGKRHSLFSRIKSAAQAATQRHVPDGEGGTRPQPPLRKTPTIDIAGGVPPETAANTDNDNSDNDSNRRVVADQGKPAVKEPRQQPVYSGSDTGTRAPLTQPLEVLVLNIMARPGREFQGDNLLEALITSGLKFGDMNIFHKRLGVEGKGPALFSVANVLNPGTFDLNRIGEFSTVGISLFLSLPAPINNLEAFEQMLVTARQVQAQMQGDLRDDNRNVLTAQTIEHYRQRIRDFELRRLKAAGGRAG